MWALPVRLGVRVEPQVRLEVGGGAEALVALAADVGLLAGVHQVMLLKVSQLQRRHLR